MSQKKRNPSVYGNLLLIIVIITIILYYIIILLIQRKIFQRKFYTEIRF